MLSLHHLQEQCCRLIHICSRTPRILRLSTHVLLLRLSLCYSSPTFSIWLFDVVTIISFPEWLSDFCFRISHGSIHTLQALCMLQYLRYVRKHIRIPHICRLSIHVLLFSLSHIRSRSISLYAVFLFVSHSGFSCMKDFRIAYSAAIILTLMPVTCFIALQSPGKIMLFCSDNNCIAVTAKHLRSTVVIICRQAYVRRLL